MLPNRRSKVNSRHGASCPASPRRTPRLSLQRSRNISTKRRSNNVSPSIVPSQLPSFKQTEEIVQRVVGQEIINIQIEPHNFNPYQSLRFALQNETSIRQRLGHKTPTKAGYFVVAWQKGIDTKTNIPYSYDESPDLFIVSILDDDDDAFQGQFVFPRTILQQQNILSSPSSSGKMAFRVYPPWCDELNKQALKTQQWQTEFFIHLPLATTIEQQDIDKIKQLYSI